jgi:prepilin-type N-terminal cleavage/methylation domain-containing protein
VSLAARLRAAVARERGYSLVEMLVVMVILSTVLTVLSNVFVSGANAELDMNRRFESQLNARLALDKMRREIHCASSATLNGSSSVTLVLPAQCPTGTGNVTWCAVGTGSRYGLHRSTADPCNATDPKWADYLVNSNVFGYVAQSTTSLAKLSVTLPVDREPAQSGGLYRLDDAIALRNSTRA